MKTKRIITVLFAIHMCVFGFTETFRVHKTVVRTVSEKTSSVHADLGINDALVIKLPENALFLQGIDLEIQIPAIAAEHRDAVAYALYADIAPEPAESTIDYTGKRLNIATFPGKLRCNIRIPLIKEHTMKESPYTIVMPLLFSKPPKSIFLRFQLVMKGVPPELFDAVYSIDIKPVLTDQGLLALTVLYPSEQKKEEHKEFSVFIDEVPRPDAVKKNVLLPVGMHRLNIVSEAYRNEVRSFTIDQAKTSLLEIQLTDIAPLLYVSAPQRTRFFMDNIEIKDYSKPLVIKPGSRQLRFSLGDYELVRVLEAVNGRTYNIAVLFDVNITEE